jgi:two-component system nitrogen regulation response regulator NtrX
MAQDILIIDDEADIRDLTSGILEDDGHQVRTARDSDEAMTSFAKRRPSLIVLDIWLQGSRMDGLELLTTFKDIDPDLPVVVISGHGTIETAVAAIRKGAYDFVEKPFTADRLLHVVTRALENTRLKRENAELKTRSAASDHLIGSSQVMVSLRAAIDRVAQTNSRVLVTGPAGAGKELVARLLHERSPRANGPFVAINAASIAPDRMESEIFGEESPDGRPRKIGVFEQAHVGTLFLDEVGDMPPETQSKILRVLVDQRFKRLHGSTDVQVNVRVVSSSSRDLSGDIAEGRFREDLYHRLNVIRLEVPPLRERADDVDGLVEQFLRDAARRTGRATLEVSSEARRWLRGQSWPGNVRELKNAIERAAALSEQDMLALDDFAHASSSTPQGLIDEASGAEWSLEQLERAYIRRVLAKTDGNRARAAKILGIDRRTLYKKADELEGRMVEGDGDEPEP